MVSKWCFAVAIALFSMGTARSADAPSHSNAHVVEQEDGPAAALAQLCKIAMSGDARNRWVNLPKAESAVTEHHISLRGMGFDYTATVRISTRSVAS